MRSHLRDSTFARRRGSAARSFLFLAGLFAAVALLSLPGYLKALQNTRSFDIHHNLAQLAQAKESWAVSNGMQLGASIAGGIETLLEEGHLEKKPFTPVVGAWEIGRVGVPPKFVIASGESFQPDLPFALTDYSGPEMAALIAEADADAASDAAPEAEEGGAEAAGPSGE